MTSVSLDRLQAVDPETGWKAPVKAATNSNITLSGEQTIDGIACVTGDRVLVWHQTTSANNGIYEVDTSSWSRALDFDGNSEVVQGTTVFVTQGTTNGGLYFKVTTADPITIGTTSLTIAQSLTSSASIMSFLQAGTGAVSRSVLSKLRDIVSVKDFGAVGDGSTDDTAAVNVAIAALNAGTIKTLVFPDGVYKVSAALTTITANGVSLVGISANGSSCAIMQSSGTASTLIFQSSNPTTTQITDICINNLAIWNSSTAPTSGTALAITRGARIKCSGLDIRNHFRGMDLTAVIESEFVNVEIIGASTWTALATNSRCFRLLYHAASAAVPSEVFFSNCDFKGATNAGQDWLDSAVEIQSGDGIWFSNCHWGFAYTTSCYINLDASASNFIDTLEFNDVFFDGNLLGAGPGVAFNNLGTNIATNIDFIGCTVKNHTQHGVQFGAGATNFSRIRFQGGSIEQNSAYGLITKAQTDISLIGVSLYNNNTGNSGADAINAVGTTNLRITSCLIKGGSHSYASGVNVDVTSSNVSVTGTQFSGCTTPITMASASFSYKGNQLVGGLYTLASAAALPSPLGFDVVSVTGVTNITSIAGINPAGAEVTFIFAGILTVTRGNNVLLTTAGGNMVTTAGSTLRMVNDGTVWREVSRAVA